MISGLTFSLQSSNCFLVIFSFFVFRSLPRIYGVISLNGSSVNILYISKKSLALKIFSLSTSTMRSAIRIKIFYPFKRKAVMMNVSVS